MQLRQGRGTGIFGRRDKEPQELQADNDLRGEDFEIACSNLGLDQDWQIYFINRLAGL